MSASYGASYSRSRSYSASAKQPLDASMADSNIELSEHGKSMTSAHDIEVASQSPCAVPEVNKIIIDDARIDPATEANAEPKEDENQRAARMLLQFWMVFMVLTGGAVDYFADFFNDIVPNTGFGDAAAVFLTTSLSFLASAIPPTLNPGDRASFKEVNGANSMFKFKVMVPALADLVVTGLRMVAILYVSPSSVSLLKTSSQLVVLGCYKHFTGKKLTWRQASCLLVAFMGEIVVTLAGSLGHVPGIDSGSGVKAVGMMLAVMSGVLGAGRNLVEEAVLQGDNLSAGGLLMAESWISFIGMVSVTLIWRASQGVLGEFLAEVWMVAHMTAIYPLLMGVMFCTYGKDFGKLLVTKRGDALLAKVLGLLFPIITWILSLLTFAISAGNFGEGLDPVASSVRLAGFVLVGGACVCFVIFQKKKM